MEHPLAQGSLLVDGRVPRDEEVQQVELAAVTLLRDHFALYGSALQLADEETYMYGIGMNVVRVSHICNDRVRWGSKHDVWLHHRYVICMRRMIYRWDL